jgi:hypothetical protein
VTRTKIFGKNLSSGVYCIQHKVLSGIHVLVFQKEVPVFLNITLEIKGDTLTGKGALHFR